MAPVLGKAERYALQRARAQKRRDRIGKELSRLLDSDGRASLHASAHAYFTEWAEALGQMLEALQYGREVDADAVVLRVHFALMQRWAKVDSELGWVGGISTGH